MFLSLFPLIFHTSQPLLPHLNLLLLSLSSHPIPLMTDMPWTKNGETAAASWNGNRYRDASAPPPAVNVPRKYFTLSPLASFFILFLPLSRERCHFILSFEAIILCP